MTDTATTDSNSRAASCTAGGIVAILLWSTTMACSRHLTEQIGIFSTGAFAFLIAGAVGMAVAMGRSGGSPYSGLSRRYLLICGGLFVLYQFTLYVAIGLVQQRAMVLTVTVINYLWPALTLAFSVPILGHRAGWGLAPGITLAIAGTALAVFDPAAAASGWRGIGSADVAALVLALVAAVSWGLYSNLVRRLAGDSAGDAVPLFFLASGAMMLALRFAFREESHWSGVAAAELLYMGLLPNLVAYSLWNRAMRRGNLVLVATLSYFIPLVSAAFTCVLLGISPGPNVVAACVLLIAGAAICRGSVRER
jgi:drug/metabolite transporter (DMT)-like permease